MLAMRPPPRWKFWSKWTVSLGVADEVEGDGVAAVERDAARVGNLHDGENAGDRDFAALHGLAGWELGGFFDLFGDALGFFFLFLGREVLAILLDQPLDMVAVDEEDLVFFGLGLLDVAAGVEVIGLLNFAKGIVLADFVELALVGLDLQHKGGDVGKRGGARGGRWLRGRLLREGKRGNHAERQ